MIKNTLFFLITFLGTTTAFANDYEVGHQALQLWNADAMSNSPPALRAWLLFMVASFALGLLFVWRHAIARWVVGGFIVSFFGSGVVARALDLDVLSGYVALAHVICWSPGLFLLLKQRPFLTKQGVTEQGTYRLWTGLITVVILISLFFDIRDTAIYLNHMGY